MQSIQRIKASDGTGNAAVATVQSPRSALATTIVVDTVAGISDEFFGSMGTPHTFIDPITSEQITVISEDTCVDFSGHVDGGNLEIDAIAPGYTDLGSAIDDIIIIRPTTQYADNIADVLAEEHDDDGKHGDITPTSVVIRNTNQDLSNQGLYANAIINGACMVAQRVTAPTLTNSYLYGAVDRFAAKGGGTAVSAGTIAQNTTGLLAATKGYEIKLAGVTLTGTGIIYLRYRMEAADALMFKNAAASFACRLYHDVGSAKNATIYIRKPTAANDFTSVTDIANSGAISVPNTTATELKFENINAGNLGDVSNGLEIEIQIAVGAITTKNFHFGDFRFNRGAKAAPFSPRSFPQEMAACQRYYEKSYNYNDAPGTNTGLGQGIFEMSVASGAVASVRFKVSKLKILPTVQSYDPVGNAGLIGTEGSNNNQPRTLDDIGSEGFKIFKSGVNRISFHYTADAEL